MRVKADSACARKRYFISSGNFYVNLFIIILLFMPLSRVFSDPLDDALDNGSFTADQQTEIRTFFENSRADGIPESFLLLRLTEGINKNIPFSGIMNTLSRENKALNESLNLLRLAGYGDLPADSDWQRTALLLLSGLSREEVKNLLYIFQNRQGDFRNGTKLYLALVQWGLEKKQAEKLVTAAAGSKIDAESYIGILDILSEGRRERIRMEELVERLIFEIGKTDTIEKLKKRSIY